VDKADKASRAEPSYTRAEGRYRRAGAREPLAARLRIIGATGARKLPMTFGKLPLLPANLLSTPSTTLQSALQTGKARDRNMTLPIEGPATGPYILRRCSIRRCQREPLSGAPAGQSAPRQPALPFAPPY
jgi:hypothetical protein